MERVHEVTRMHLCITNGHLTKNQHFLFYFIFKSSLIA